MPMSSAPAGVAVKRGSYRDLLQQSNCRRLCAIALCGRLGGQVWRLALVLFTLQAFDPFTAGIAVLTSVIPGLALSPAIGALLDRYGRTRLILIDYSVSSVSSGAIAILSLTHRLTPPELILITTVASLTTSLSTIGVRSLYPQLVHHSQWDRMNAIDTVISQSVAMIGPTIAGFVVARAGGEAALLLAAGAFLAGAVALSALHEGEAVPRESSPLWRDALGGLTYVARNPSLRGLSIVVGAQGAGIGMLAIALPLLVTTRFRTGPGAIGLLWALQACLTILSSLWIAPLLGAGRERLSLTIGMLAYSAGLAVLWRAPSLPLMALGMAIAGGAAGPISVSVLSLRQRRTDPEWFGRSIAISIAINSVGVPVGAALAGRLVSLSMEWTLVLMTLMPAVAAIAAMTLIPREPDDGVRDGRTSHRSQP